MNRCSCCGGEIGTGGCARCSSRITLCAHCGATLSCGCGWTAGDHRCRMVVPVTLTISTPEGSATIDCGRIALQVVATDPTGTG